MKKLLKSLVLFAAAAMALTSCENEMIEEGIELNDTYTMTFVTGAPESRTSVAIDGATATYSWSAGDKVGFYYVATDVDYKKKGNSNAATIAEYGTATFVGNFTAATNATETTTYNIGAFYPGNSWGSHADENYFNNVNVRIAATQALTAGSFDPTADLMMAKPFMNVALNSDDVKSLEFTRIAAIGKMNLKLTDMVEGEVIKSVKFTLAEGSNFNGPVVLDLENQTYELGEGSNAVTLTGSLAAEADRTAVYFTCFPGEYTGAYTIEVATDKATYSKEGTLTKALTFTAGDVVNFNATVGNRVKNLTMTFDPAEVNLTVGETFTAPTLNFDYEDDFEVVYSVVGDIASVTDNVVSINTAIAGEATVTATFAGNSEYNPATASYTVKVTPANSYEVTYTVASTSTVSVSGTAPTGSSATYTSSYTTKCQLTKNNTMTLTLSGYDGKKITGLTMSMKSNKSAGAGSFSMKVGDNTISSIATNNFSNAAWNGSYTTTYVDVTPAVVATTVGTDEKIVITITATVNSLYCQSFTLTYENDGTTDDGTTDDGTTGEDNTGNDNTGSETDPVVVLSEEFDNSTDADSTNAIDKSKFPNFSGDTSKAYTSRFGGIKLGSSSVVGYITSKSLDLSSSFTVQLDACKYGNDTGDIVVTVDGQTQKILNSELSASNSADDFKTFILSFNAATTTATVKIATSAKRAYIDNVVVTVNK